ncbi:PAS domain S-box protein [Paenibacillus sp. J2TS4]|uniref:PAS domain S-box protein n=1 Tax=Paenibacillus sp. J2TS4 TaxID=2807194 RepID=UPI001B1D9127|nr:PAS domain S-box protein [Paenibacillus sp. J2TS4]GIP35064.1 hypothetical protein J2TS4_42740 [Paenibacillus sp. J2TS4]
MTNNGFYTFSYNRSPKSDKLMILHEWEKFISGMSSQVNIRPFMFNSWKRCKELGIDPLLNEISYSLGMDQIQEYINSDRLFQMIKPFLKKLKQHSENTGYIVTYCNAAGELIYYDGDLSILLKAEDINLAPGADWSEGSAGTNAIGTALVTGMPIQVFASEHYCREIHGWTCSASPIRDPGTGEILGIIDLSGFWTTYDPRSIEAVIGTAREIESMLYNHLKLERRQLSQYFAELTKTTTLPLAVIDRGGRVVQASPILYDKGWISANHGMKAPFPANKRIPDRMSWELDDGHKNWRFELSPFYYGGEAIGSIVYALPPEIANFKHLPSLGQSLAASNLPEEEAGERPGALPHDKLYNSLFKHHPDAIFCYDLQGVLLDANPAAATMLGYTISELRDISNHDKFILPDGKEDKKQAFAQAVGGELQQFEAIFLHKLGHRVYVTISSFPIIIDNEIMGVYEAVREVKPNYQQMFEDLKSTKEQLDFYLSNTEDAILIVDTHLLIVKANEAFERIYGWTEQELLGKELPTIPDYLQSEAEELWSNLLNSRHAIPYETVRLRKDGTLIDVSNCVAPLFDNKGNAVAYVLISRDITELKKMEESLRKTEKLAVVGQLAAGIAHEIRNPLTTLKGFVSLLRDQMPDKNNWYFEVMLSEIKQMELLADQFLTVAKPQTMRYEQRNVETLIRQVTSFLYPLALMNNVQIALESESDHFPIQCEENQIKQVFINIIKNAVEAMPQGGQVTIKIQHAMPCVSIRITDHGCGIPQDRIPFLGEPFYSLKEKGTGLGLMVCNKIIKEHHGNLHITSEENRGTTVEIILPLIAP